MAELRIDTGNISLDIIRDGTIVGVFQFNPTDIVQAKKHAEIVEELERNQTEILAKAKELDEHGTKLDSTKFMEDFVVDIRGKIDAVYGAGNSDMLFGDCLNVDNIISFFEQLQPYYAEASKKRKAKYQKK